ncbi:MAG: hypothetical protein D6715_11865 [Calditrichaeota bacterium]|nr:MAG: hypothetical protein D6715_11865 [Calditrichota bacterium]
MKNLFKATHIFRCNHEAHNGFSSEMSVHHILNVKQCYPHGCFYLRGRCKLMLKGKTCYRGFQAVGKKCAGCRYLEEQTVHCQPELQISAQEFSDFERRLEAFREWLDEHEGRELDIQGRIAGVKPLLEKQILPHGERLALRGVLLSFDSIYLDRTLLEDRAFVRVSAGQQRRFAFARGMSLWARATLHLDRGRFVLSRLRQVDIESPGEPPEWSESRARVVLRTATHLPVQLPPCHRCPSGTLVDVTDQREGVKNYRHLYCLQGQKDPFNCPQFLSLSRQLEADNGHPRPACLQRNVIIY